MRARIKMILQAAAGLVVTGGLALSIALNQAGQSEGLTCEEWDQLARYAQQIEGTTWFVAVQQGYSPPAAVGDRILGDCAEGTCSVKPGACELPAIEYEYRVSDLVNGWRLALIDGPLYFAGGWKQLASEQSEVRFYRGWKDLKADCLAHLTGAQCLHLVSSINDCWDMGDGTFCRNGLLYGPGLGGVDSDGNHVTCSPDGSSTPYPCTSKRGAEWFDRATVDDFPGDSELEL